VKQKKTVGQWSKELIEKSDDRHSVEEQMREQLSDYDKELYRCFDDNKQKYKTRFYIVVLTRGERALKNVIRHQFFARNSCPTPEYDQTVYQCHKDWAEPRFMWVIPCKGYCDFLIANSSRVPQEEWQLLRFVLDLEDGTLLKLAKKLNNEKEDSGFLILEA